uniref:F-box domain-containing protein n=1 Tax=Mycena chlorophos TaxID=658473 RepID=A0ABQ0LG24_MYCCL|nr:predicted protein [Mycena chlorophos]
MDKITSFTAALHAGKLPSTEQASAFIDWFMASVIPADHDHALSEQGRILADDIRRIIQSYKVLGARKNGDDILQEALWSLSKTNVDVAVSTDGTNQLVDRKETSSDLDSVRSSVETLLSIFWESISSERDFLLSDFASFLFLALADASEALEERAGLAKEQLRAVQEDLRRDKKHLEEEDAKVIFESRTDAIKDTVAQDTTDQATTHLWNAYWKVCKRVQQDPEYRDSLTTLFKTAHKWINLAFGAPADEPFSLNIFIEDQSQDQHVHKALDSVFTLLDRLVEPRSSVDSVLGATNRFVSAVGGDSDVRAWVDKYFEHIQRSIDDPKYPDSDQARATRRDLRERGNTITEADTDAGRAWAEFKEILRAFFSALASDEDVRDVRNAYLILGEDVQQGLVRAGTRADLSIKAVLGQATWFWRDLFTAYAPRLLRRIKDVRVPRTEYVDDELELVLENLDISSFELDPTHIFVRNITEVDVHTSKTTDNTETSSGAATHIRLQAVQLALKDVSFYYKDKDAKIPANNHYTGLLTMTLPPQGIDVDIRVRLIPDAKDREATCSYHVIEHLDVHIADSCKIDVHESNHSILLSLFRPLFNKRFRQAVARSLSEHLRLAMDWMGGVAWDVGRRTEVLRDAGMRGGPALVGAVWSEMRRLLGELRVVEMRATSTGVVLAVPRPDSDSDSGDDAKLALGVEPQVLSGEKRGPVGAGSQSVPVDDQVDAKDTEKGVQVVVGQSKEHLRSFQRAVEEKAREEEKKDGPRSREGRQLIHDIHDAPMPTIPGEIVDQIIDHLVDDNHSLLQCALVSSAWLPRSRFHAFSSIHIPFDNAWAPGRIQKDLARFDALQSLLSSPMVSFPTSIRMITMELVLPAVDDTSILDIFSGRFLTSLEAAGARPRTLRLSGDLQAAYFVFRPVPFNSSLVELQVEDGLSRIECMGPLLEFVSCYPLLESLSITRRLPTVDPNTEPPNCSPPPLLRSLDLGPDYAHVLEWISCENKEQNDITELGFFGIMGGWDALPALTRKVGENIQTLRLLACTPLGIEYFLEIRHFPKLRHLYIMLNCLSLIAELAHDILKRLQLSSASSLRTLETINFIPVYPDWDPKNSASYPRPSELRRLDELLVPDMGRRGAGAASDWPAFRQLTIRPASAAERAMLVSKYLISLQKDLALTYGSSYPRAGVGFSESIRLDMPRCAAQGLLRVELPDLPEEHLLLRTFYFEKRE